MKALIFTILLIFFITVKSYSQWPGSFYAFELIGEDGRNVDSLSKDYRFSIDTIAPGLSSIEICEDNKTWRLYKGDKNLFVPSVLTIEKLSADGSVQKSITIKFPPPMTGGKEKYYAQMYLGKIEFGNANYKIRFPKKPEEWDGLKEVELCPSEYNFNKYLDISRYQK